MCKPISRRTLIDWLHIQEKVIALWRDDMAVNYSSDMEFIESLETHHDWLSNALVHLRQKTNTKI